MNIPRLSELQAEYDSMVAIAMATLNADQDLDPEFERELTQLMKLVKALGGQTR